jgi:hypothetical protein
MAFVFEKLCVTTQHQEGFSRDSCRFELLEFVAVEQFRPLLLDPFE